MKSNTTLDKTIAAAAIASEILAEHTELYQDYNPGSDSEPSFDEHSQWQQPPLTDLEKQRLLEVARLLDPDNQGLREGEDWLINAQNHYTTDNRTPEKRPQQRERPCNLQ